MKKIDYTEVTIKLMDEYTSKYLQENAELVQDTIKATLEAINYSRCCKSDSELLCDHPMSERADIVGSSRTYCLKCSTTL